MRFSIIVPAHNAAGFLGTALGSICSQTFVDFELLVVADNCTDNTAEVARSFGIDPIISTGGTPGLARNAGMDRASGDYLLFLDADDWFLVPDALHRIQNALVTTDEPHLLHFGFMWGATPCGGLQQDGSHYHHVWSRAWHRNAIGTSRMTALPAGQDTVFTLALLEKRGLTHAVYDFPLVQHVLDRPGSVTYTHLAKKRRGDESMMSGLNAHLNQEVDEARLITVPSTR